MSPVDGNSGWMFAVRTIILFSGVFLEINVSSFKPQICTRKKILFVCTGECMVDVPSDISEVLKFNVTEVCVWAVNTTNTNTQHKTGCCTNNFNCDIEIIPGQVMVVSLDENTLSDQDVVVMTGQLNNSIFNSPSVEDSMSLLNLSKRLHPVNGKPIPLTKDQLCDRGSSYDQEACEGLPETRYKLTLFPNNTKCVSCQAPGIKPNKTIGLPLPPVNPNGGVSPEAAVNIMDSLSYALEQMGTESIATISAGNVTGTLVKLDPEDSEEINYGIKRSGDMNIVENVTDLGLSFPRSVHIPKEASDQALERNGSFSGVLLFPDMYQDDANSFFINNEILGIDMGAQISNLSNKINIQYNEVDKKGMVASCRSWDGKDTRQTWITDGCETEEINGSIICSCSHLTFFAILLSPPPGNISSADFKSLTYITSIGCGLSMFFLAVALFMHCLIRKQRASQSIQLLMNLFVAMFSLNLFFLINETIAKLGNYGACVAMAAAMHYAMLATFSWFFIEALNLYFNLWLVPTQIKHYMMKLSITGWVTPAVVVVALLASRQYDFMAIYTDDGNSAKMCWIPDATIHQGVNIGYYAVVFIFTFIIFIITVRQIVQLKSTADKVAATAKRQSSIKTNSFSIFGLLLLLGITWAFAFFSHGPLLLASYYIFTILNSFQGFFLFIYYYNSSKTAAGDQSASASGSSTATPDTVLSSPYQ